MSRFITFEGGDGVGKSTQIRRLGETLKGNGRTVLMTREPGGSSAAEALRRILLDPELPLSSEAETLLLFAGRADHVAATILPALARGEIVLCDRFYDSTLVYQGTGVQADAGALAWIKTLMARVVRHPDLTVVLDLPPEESHRRAALRSRGEGGSPRDRYESRDLSFHRRVRDGFRDRCLMEPERCVLVNAEGTAEAVQARVLAVVEQRFSL